MKKRKLTEQEIIEWKQNCIAVLEGLYTKPLGQLKPVLLTPGVLRPHIELKGHYLLEPEMMMTEAHLLRKGMVKLYSENTITREVKILDIWLAGSFIVLFENFTEKLPNENYYIQLITDCELVSITNFCMDTIYAEHISAHELTQKIQHQETARRALHTEILLMADKRRRYCVLKQKFPALFANGKPLLGNTDICDFLGMSDTCLKLARQICPD